MDQPAPPTPLLSSLLGFLATLLILVAFYLVRKREERGWLMGLAVGAFLLKAILVPIYFQWLVSLGDYGFAYFDAAGYHEQGLRIAEEFIDDAPRSSWAWQAIDPGFYQVTAYTYLIFGPNTLVIRFFLIMCVSVSLLYIYRITEIYFGERTARIAATMQACLPAPIVLTMNHRKDPLVQLIMLFTFYHSVRVFRQDSGWQRSAIGVVAGLVAVYPFRSGLVLPFIGVMVISFALANRNMAQGFALSILTVLGLLTFQFVVSDDSRLNLEAFTARAEAKLEESAYRSEGGGGLVRFLRMNGPLDLYKVPFAAAAYLILPFPPKIDSYEVATLISLLNLASVFLLPHMLLGIWSLIRGPNWRIRLPLLVFPIVFMMLLGAVHPGVIRYREIFYPACLIWAAVGWQIGTSIFLRLPVYGVLMVLAVIVYVNRASTM